MKVPQIINKAILQAYAQLLDRGFKAPAGKWQGTDEFSHHYMKVLYNHDFVINIPVSQTVLAERSYADMPWAEEHFQERISGQPLNPGEAYKRWPYNTFGGNNDEFLRHDGKFSHTYMERFAYHHNLDKVIKVLQKNPGTRQAYFPIFFPDDVEIGLLGDRIPCTLGYHFHYFGKRLHINYYIRSCDAFRHFHNDIYFTGRLLQHVAKETKHQPGNAFMYIANLHIFENDEYHIKKRLKQWNYL